MQISLRISMVEKSKNFVISLTINLTIVILQIFQLNIIFQIQSEKSLREVYTRENNVF